MLKIPIFLSLLLIIQFFSAFAVAKDEYTQIILTTNERAWLDAHPNIQLGTATSYPPFIIKHDNNTHTGLILDVFKLINQRLNSNIKVHIEDSWLLAQEKAKSGIIDGLAIAGKDKSRDKIFNATNILFPTYFYVFSRSGNEFSLTSMKDLEGLKVGYKRAAVPTKRILDSYPGITTIAYEDNLSLSQGLLKKEVDVGVAWISFDYWRRESLQGTIENRLIIADHPVNFVIYNKKSWPELTAILNKAVDSIREDGLAQLMDKWFVKRIEPKSETKLNLTIKERNWLKQHPKILFGFDPSWAPIEYADKEGNPQGMSPGYMKRVAKMLNIEIKPIPGLSWNMAVERMAERQLDILPATSKTTERLKTMSFTEPYLSLPIAIFADTKMTFVGNIKELYEQKVAVPNNYAIHEWLKRDHPKLNLVPVKDNLEGLNLLSTGEVVAFIGNLVTTSYSIGKTALLNIRVVGQTAYTNKLSVAVRKDWPELNSIMQKALNSIPESEKQAIYNDWISIQYQHDFNYALMWKILVVFAIVIFSIIYWNRKLSHEIERRKIAELELIKAKNIAESASQAKSIFLSSISHDLKTPLSSILGYSELIELKTTDKEIKTHTEVIVNSGNHILDLISQLLELSKIESGVLKLLIKKHEINKLLQENITTISPVASQRGITVENLIPTSLEMYVDVDKIRFKQIILNLLSNAIKYNRQNGKVIINYKIINDEFIRISIEDTGVGLTEEQQKHLFKAYDRAGAEKTEVEGTGLGLVISKDLIEKMNGNIGVESEYGKGTCFWIQIPISK